MAMILDFVWSVLAKLLYVVGALGCLIFIGFLRDVCSSRRSRAQLPRLGNSAGESNDPPLRSFQTSHGVTKESPPALGAYPMPHDETSEKRSRWMRSHRSNEDTTNDLSLIQSTQHNRTKTDVSSRVRASVTAASDRRDQRTQHDILPWR